MDLLPLATLQAIKASVNALQERDIIAIKTFSWFVNNLPFLGNKYLQLVQQLMRSRKKSLTVEKKKRFLHNRPYWLPGSSLQCIDVITVTGPPVNTVNSTSGSDIQSLDGHVGYTFGSVSTGREEGSQPSSTHTWSVTWTWTWNEWRLFFQHTKYWSIVGSTHFDFFLVLMICGGKHRSQHIRPLRFFKVWKVL